MQQFKKGVIFCRPVKFFRLVNYKSSYLQFFAFGLFLARLPSSAGGQRFNSREIPHLQALQPFYPKCENLLNYVFYFGAYRMDKLYNNFDWCQTKFFNAAIVLACISLTLNILSVLCLLCSSGKLSRKYQQLVYLDVVNALMELCFLIMIFYRFLINHPTRLPCVFIHQFFGLSGNIFMTAIISLSTDCLIAILYPLQYRSIVTVRRTLKANGVVISLLFILLFVIPMAVFPWRFGGYIWDCNVTLLYSTEFLFMSFGISALLLILMASLNIVIMITAAYALCNRKKMTGEADALVQKKIAQIVARLAVVVVVNFGCSLPLMTLSFGKNLLNPSLSFLLFVSLGVSNNLIYFIGDKGVRSRASNLTNKCSKN